MLADGTSATIRLLDAADRPAVERLFAEASEADLYTRFFTLSRAAVAHHVQHLFGPGGSTLTYVVERQGAVLGIADVEREDEHTAEIAFLVADGLHGLGIGTLLLERAADDAQERGITTFVADVLAVNHPMIQVFHDAGFHVELVNRHEDVSVQMSTRRTDEALAATAARHAAALAHARPRAAAATTVIDDDRDRRRART